MRKTDCCDLERSRREASGDMLSRTWAVLKRRGPQLDGMCGLKSVRVEKLRLNQVTCQEEEVEDLEGRAESSDQAGFLSRGKGWARDMGDTVRGRGKRMSGDQSL